jgi:hypothetical protein
MDLNRELNSSGSEWSPVADSCEHDNEPLTSIKDHECLTS